MTHKQCYLLHRVLSDLQEPIAKIGDPELEGEGKALALWKPSCIQGIRLLTLCTSEGSLPVLSAWGGHAGSIKAVVATVMNMPEVQQPGTQISSAFCTSWAVIRLK